VTRNTTGLNNIAYSVLRGGLSLAGRVNTLEVALSTVVSYGQVMLVLLLDFPLAGGSSITSQLLIFDSQP